MSKARPKKIDENHSFNINVACMVGDRKAILLKEIYGWCDRNLSNNKNIHYGLPWTYNSAKAYHDKFPYWPEKSIARWLKDLQKDGWIYATDKFNRFSIDRTKWYTIHFERYDLAVLRQEMSISQNEKWVKEVNESISQNEESISQNDTSAYLKMRNDISQNEEPIPSLTISSSSLTSKRAHKTEPQKSIPVKENSPSKKVAPKKVFEPVHENDFPATDEDLTILDTTTPDWIDVAKKMADFFKGPGSEQWKAQCDQAGGYVDPLTITMAWAGQNCDAPTALRNWYKYRGKFINWIRNELKGAKFNQAKFRSMKKQPASIAVIDDSKYDKYRTIQN